MESESGSGDRLRRLWQQIEDRERLLDRIDGLDIRAGAARTHLQDGEREISDLRIALAELNGLSLRGLWMRLSGSYQEEIDRLQWEIGRLDKVVAQRLAESESLTAEADRAVAEEKAIPVSIDQEYTDLLERKADRVRANGGADADRLEELDRALDRATGRLEELRHAQEAAQRAFKSAARVEDYLRRAEELGLWDILGGDVIATAMKRDRLDSAKDASVTANRDLERLRAELESLDEFEPRDISVDGSSALIDYLFDGFFGDLWVQSKIEQSRETVQGLLDGLGKLRDRLTGSAEQASSDHESARESRRSWIHGR